MTSTTTVPTQIKVVTIRTTATLAEEFYRLARVEGRTGNTQGEILIREWVAAQQAAEAMDAAA